MKRKATIFKPKVFGDPRFDELKHENKALRDRMADLRCELDAGHCLINWLSGENRRVIMHYTGLFRAFDHATKVYWDADTLPELLEAITTTRGTYFGK